MSKFKPYKADQVMLFPHSINDYVPKEHLARVVNDTVEELNTTEVERKYSDLGQNTYHPRILIKLLFYGYAMGERSGRKICRRCETDTAYIYLAQMYQPDFRTINDCRKNNLKELSQYFMDIVRICQEMGLVKLGQINIDGTKIKANAANRLTKTRDEYQRWLEKTDKKIKDILREAEETDRAEDALYGDKRGDELPAEINTAEKLKKKLKEVMKKFKTEAEQKKPGPKKINLTDPEAKFMKSGGGRIDISYNCQLAVTNEQLIVGNDVINDPTDKEALKGIIQETEKSLKKKIKEVAADAGYTSYENYEYLAKNKKIGYLPDSEFEKIKKGKSGDYAQEKFIYNQKQDGYVCPEGKKLDYYKTRRKDYWYRKFRKKTYKGSECHLCAKRVLCTKQPQRTIDRDDRRQLVEDMRKRLLSKEGQAKYQKRLYTTEPVFGHFKHNLGYRYFLLRTLEKVKAEFKLMCIGYNLKKMHRLMAFSG